MNAVHVRTARPPVRYLCTFCAAHVANADALRTAPNPFDPRDTLTGCPACGAVNATVRACDEPGCWQPADCGFPTPDGYRSTCSKHIPLAGEPRCQHESSPDDGTRPVGEHTGVPAAFPTTNMNTTNQKPQTDIRFRSKISGLWYSNPRAAGTYNAITVNGKILMRKTDEKEYEWICRSRKFIEAGEVGQKIE